MDDLIPEQFTFDAALLLWTCALNECQCGDEPVTVNPSKNFYDLESQIERNILDKLTDDVRNVVIIKAIDKINEQQKKKQAKPGRRRPNNN